MILARPIRLDRDDDLEPAWERIGLVPSARQLLLESVGRVFLLVTGLGTAETRFLQDVDDARVTVILSDSERRPGGATVSGTRAGLEALARAAERAGRVELAWALDAATAADVPPDPTVLGGRTFRWGERTFLMGVVNVTPDSFSDGGVHLERVAAVRHALALAEAGADLIDVGGESTRPGAAEVPVQVELDRVLPVIESVRATSDVPVSVDTRKAAVAREALRLGAVLVNDVSGLGHDPALATVVAESGAALALMHIQGTPETMQADPRYDDVVAEVIDFLSTRVDRAVAAGVARERILGRPGHRLREDRRPQPLPPPPSRRAPGPRRPDPGRHQPQALHRRADRRAASGAAASGDPGLDRRGGGAARGGRGPGARRRGGEGCPRRRRRDRPCPGGRRSLEPAPLLTPRAAPDEPAGFARRFAA